MGETSKKFWTAAVLVLGMTGFTLSILGADDQTVTTFAVVAALLGIMVGARSRFDKPAAQPLASENAAHLEDRRSEVTAGDPYGRWWRQGRG
ncbi:hypothetical protein [Nesterenkonia sandarakina]|uniref:Uncharacterized protein n=1 Tax=Nesterenkonia sandarakina TaxID=272918 RepID=A0A2T0YFM7_9MICC|nr:hypothetical protein [Nesterenkonia sandarakina]PRZ13677.1 hypothetical protein BCL67_1144 [Nesterenkonia sandarakina]